MTARILVVDDLPDNVEIIRVRLESQNYAVETAADGLEALERVAASPPDLILLDVMMPRLNGIEAVKRLKADPTLPFVPVILLTAMSETREVIHGLDAGADEYLTKPVDHGALLARVRAILRIKSLHDTVEKQRIELAGWNRTLEERVAAQVGEIERIGRLKRFLSPQVAELILGQDAVLNSHRREVVVLVCDIRGFTAFAETGEPEEVMALLQGYHEALGPLIHRAEATLERFTGDGLMLFFNDPLPCSDPAERAVRLAVEMRDAVTTLAQAWRRRGQQIGFGIGIAQGYATLGRIGFEGRIDYGAIGTVTNLAARLCAEAKDGEILVTSRVALAVEPFAELRDIGEVAFKGLSRPTVVSHVIGLKTG